MQRTITHILLMCLALMLAGCASTSASTPPTLTTVAISIRTSTPTIPVPTAGVPVATAIVPMSVDADGYHVIGDPAAPVVMTDYSD